MSSTEMVKCGLSIWGFTKQHDGASFMKDILLVPLWLLTLAALIGAQSLDYQTYKATVEPIFLKKRPTHARCIVCHARQITRFV
jgi:hypothetical protein